MIPSPPSPALLMDKDENQKMRTTLPQQTVTRPKQIFDRLIVSPQHLALSDHEHYQQHFSERQGPWRVEAVSAVPPSLHQGGGEGQPVFAP